MDAARRRFGAVAVALSLAAPTALAAPITDVTPAFHARAAASYQHSFLEGFYEFNGLRAGQAEIETQQVDVVVRGGVYRNAEIRVQVPFVTYQATRLFNLDEAVAKIPTPPGPATPAPNGRLKANGLGDIGLGLRYALLNPQTQPAGRIAWVLDGDIFLNTGDTDTAAPGTEGGVGYGAMHYRLGTAFSKPLGSWEPYFGFYFTDYLKSDDRDEDRGTEWEMLSGTQVDLFRHEERDIRFSADTGLRIRFADRGRGDLLRQVIGAPHFQTAAEQRTDTDRYSVLSAWLALIYQINRHVLAGIHFEGSYITNHLEDSRHGVGLENAFQLAGRSVIELRY